MFGRMHLFRYRLRNKHSGAISEGLLGFRSLREAKSHIKIWNLETDWVGSIIDQEGISVPRAVRNSDDAYLQDNGILFPMGARHEASELRRWRIIFEKHGYGHLFDEEKLGPAVTKVSAREQMPTSPEITP